MATRLPGSTIEVIFGVVLLVSVYLTLALRDEPATSDARCPKTAASRGAAAGRQLPDAGGRGRLPPQRVPLGFGMMAGAGALSGLLGIGSGAVKVLALDQAMRLPFKVSTTTSNFMIGVTAAASAGIYLRRGSSSPASPCRSCSVCSPARWSERAFSWLPTRVSAARLRAGDPRSGRRDDRGGAAPVNAPRGSARWSDRAVEVTMGVVLRVGVTLAALLVAPEASRTS